MTVPGPVIPSPSIVEPQRQSEGDAMNALPNNSAPNAVTWARRRLFAGNAVLAVLAGILIWRWMATDTAGDAIAVAAQRQRPTPEQQFDMQPLAIPRDEVFGGGPGKDGIPALTDPKFVTPATATYLQPADQVIGVARGDDARCYPLKVLNWHECVNDTVDGTPLAITYCPLCDSSLVFDRRVDGRELEFGVSGLLYNSNVLLYSRNADGPETLWSQMKAEGVSGDAVGASLKTVPFEVTTWSDWKSRYPNTKVLSPQTGHRRDYSQNPYSRYFAIQTLMFPVRPLPPQGMPYKEPVLGVWTDGAARAYPLKSLRRIEDSSGLKQTLGSESFTLQLDPPTATARITEASEGIDHAYTFWFAWYAFHPETEVYQP
ncbi:MAG: DUF3179 domain-containing protein [Maioricimonas sp. JB049]